MTTLYDVEFFNQRTLLLKEEVAEGTSSNPTPVANAFQLFEGKASTEMESVERKLDRPFFTASTKLPTNRRRVIEGSFEIVPPAVPGTQPAPCDLILQIGGMARSYDAAAWVTRYNPISRGIKTATAHWYHGLRFTEVTGCRAAISAVTFKIGDFTKASSKIQGSFIDVTDAALPTNADFSGFRSPVVVAAENAALVVGDIAVIGKELTLDFGSDLKAQEYTGVRLHRIVGRAPTYKVRFVPPPAVDFDAYAKQRRGEIIPISFLVREEDGRTTVLFVRGQIEKVDEADIDGDYGYELSGNVLPDAGNDEFLLFFSKPLALVDTMTDLGSVGSSYAEGPLDIKGTVIGPVTWSIAAGAGPTGAVLNAETGMFTGTCTAAGTFTPTIRMTDAAGQTAELEVSITISP